MGFASADLVPGSCVKAHYLDSSVLGLVCTDLPYLKNVKLMVNIRLSLNCVLYESRDLSDWIPASTKVAAGTHKH